MGGKSKKAKWDCAAHVPKADSRPPDAAVPEKAGLSLAGRISICTVSERAVSEPGLGGLVWSVKWQ